VEWLRGKIREGSCDRWGVEEWYEVVRKAKWPFSPQSIEHLLKERDRGVKFNAVVGYQEAKRLMPILDYCIEVLGLKFKGREEGLIHRLRGQQPV